MADFFSGLSSVAQDEIFSYITLIIRYILPIPAVLTVVRCAVSLLRRGRSVETWGYLSLPNGSRIPLEHWENIIGRARDADVHMAYPSLSRSHAAVIRDGAGVWRVYDLGSKGGARVNGAALTPGEGRVVKSGDLIDLGSVKLIFVGGGAEGTPAAPDADGPPAAGLRPGATLVFLTEFQLLLGVQACIAKSDALTAAVPASFAALIAVMWVCYALTRSIGRVGFEIETLAFFLCAIGLSITASSAPEALWRQTAFLCAGILLYCALGWFLRDLDRTARMRWPAGAVGLVLLVVNLLLGDTIFGAKNWLQIGGLSFQPSEFVKIAFVFAGSATLDRLFAKRNLLLFIAYAGACVLALALMRDFGSALVFFVAFLVIAFIRSGDAATVFLSVGGAAFAGFLAVAAREHIAARFSSWGRAWENVNTSGGFQQTRAMSAAAGGGLFGAGSGNGWLKQIFAADTDLVFGMTCEELGLIIAVTAVAAVAVFAVFAVRSASAARSSYYVTGACASASILVFQLALNVLGSTDILPFTGVTFPFVSKGGSSLIACWGLLAFIKAADTRPGASFAIKLPARRRRKERRDLRGGDGGG
ncbi:MAG: FtsW/RodA/SpoVE family cell cycle protein [Oscillospiraceae bacterium]|jgi:cell division protein FtsW (lipid II flippase)|nr:FtsW/RodA/SpoVE family cell cycle protein [Oscillospiraceae bacterium]